MADLSSVETLRAAADRVWTGPNPHPWADIDPDAARALAGWLEHEANLHEINESTSLDQALAVARVLLGVPNG